MTFFINDAAEKGRMWMWVWALGRVETIGLKGDIMFSPVMKKKIELLELIPANSRVICGSTVCSKSSNSVPHFNIFTNYTLTVHSVVFGEEVELILKKQTVILYFYFACGQVPNM